MEGSELLKFQLLLMKPEQKCNGFNAFYHEHFFNKENNPEGKFSMADEIVEKWGGLTKEEKTEWVEKEEALRHKYQAEREHKTGKKSQNKPRGTEQKKNDEEGVDELQKSVKQMKISERKKDHADGQHKVQEEVINEEHQSIKKRGRPRRTGHPQEENHSEEGAHEDHQSAKKRGKPRKTDHEVQEEDEAKKDNEKERSPEVSAKKSLMRSGAKSGCSKRKM